ncbi:hypothetical protein EV183_003858 [Coemansia sp. RSA 2336]|nr:hypothetical protein EV183_003858 [Coemansia sp. RSA 2336]
MFQFLSRSRTAIRLALHKFKVLLLARESNKSRKLVRKKHTNSKRNTPKNYTEFSFTLRPVKKDDVTLMKDPVVAPKQEPVVSSKKSLVVPKESTVTPKKSVAFADKVELFEFSQDNRVQSTVIPIELQIDEFMNGKLVDQRRVSIESIMSTESTSSSESEVADATETAETIDQIYEELMALRNELLKYYDEPEESHPSQQLPIAISV